MSRYADGVRVRGRKVIRHSLISLCRQYLGAALFSDLAVVPVGPGMAAIVHTLLTRFATLELLTQCFRRLAVMFNGLSRTLFLANTATEAVSISSNVFMLAPGTPPAGSFQVIPLSLACKPGVQVPADVKPGSITIQSASAGKATFTYAAGDIGEYRFCFTINNGNSVTVDVFGSAAADANARIVVSNSVAKPDNSNIRGFAIGFRRFR